MLRLNSKITINNTTFTAVVQVDIESTWQNLTDTCIIQVPNNFKREGRPITVGDTGFFKRGDKVEVQLGYFPTLTTEFTGYIRKIFVDNVIKIEVEDASYLLKQSTKTFSAKAVTAESLLADISPIEYQTEDAQLGKFRITRVTPAQVLAELKKKYGLVSYIRNEVLRVGLAYYLDEGRELEFDLEKTVIENDLEFIDVNELKPTVLGINSKDDNTIVEKWAYYEAGKTEPTIADKKPEGYEQTDKISISEEVSETTLEDLITNTLKRRISTGIRGSFKTFLQPSVQHGDRVKLKSRKFPEKEGTYLVKKVVKSFGLSGGRQEITLDTKIAE
jgi:hypothetical protein